VHGSQLGGSAIQCVKNTMWDAERACSSIPAPGFVLVKKVPGTMHFLAKSESHSFDFHAQNLTHVVDHLFIGNKPSPRRFAVGGRAHASSAHNCTFM
jgi:hypothetical protein